MVETTVSLGANGQYKVTVPKGIAEAMDLNGASVEWTIKSGRTIELTISDE